MIFSEHDIICEKNDLGLFERFIQVGITLLLYKSTSLVILGCPSIMATQYDCAGMYFQSVISISENGRWVSSHVLKYFISM